MCMIIRSFLSVLHLIILTAISNRFYRQESLSSYFLYFCRKGLTNFLSVWGILKEHFWLYSLSSMVCSSHGKEKRLRDCWAASRSHCICPPHSCPSVVGQRWLLGFLGFNEWERWGFLSSLCPWSNRPRANSGTLCVPLGSLMFCTVGSSWWASLLITVKLSDAPSSRCRTSTLRLLCRRFSSPWLAAEV